jgi:hypothetical protein
VRAERGDHLGLQFDTDSVSLFDRSSGRALVTDRLLNASASLATLGGVKHG